MRNETVCNGGGIINYRVTRSCKNLSQIHGKKSLENVISRNVLVLFLKRFYKDLLILFKKNGKNYCLYIYYMVLLFSSSSIKNVDCIGKSDTFSAKIRQGYSNKFWEGSYWKI